MKSPKARRDTKVVGSGPAPTPGIMDSSLRDQMEASLRNQMDASVVGHQMLDSSDASHYEGGGRRSTGGGGAPPKASTPSENDFARDALLEQIVNPYIEDDSPAAEALRANAQVHIGKMSKVARSINAQALRKIVKRASMRGQFGKVKGKPPRVLPSQLADLGDDTGDENGFAPQSPMSGIEEVSEDASGADLGDSKGSMPPHPDDDCESDSEGSSVANDNAQSKDKSSVGQSSPAREYKNGSRSGSPNKESGKVITKDPPKITEYTGDHLHYSLQHMKKYAPSVKNLAPTTDNKDIPQEVVEGTMEAGRKVMKSVDPHDILKLTRWKRKKKRDKKDKKERKSYVIGKVIDRQHELYAQSIAVMLGVRTSIARTNAEITAEQHKKRWLTDADFNHCPKYEFRPDGSADTPPHQLSHTFKFKDYAPVAFAYLRRLFGVNEFDFLLSVCGNANFIEFISNAKSGQFFFYSSDGKYMIKTMTTAESKFLKRILPDYFKHCCANPNTMLTKFCGMYRVKLYHLRRNVKFVIMNSVFYTDKPLHKLYDLKGSIHGRDSDPGDAVQKDNDLRRSLPDGALALPPELRDRVRRQLIRDCNFLQKKQIMDYSMLVGIHHVAQKPKEVDGYSVKSSTRSSVRRPSFVSQSMRGLHAGGSGEGSHEAPLNDGMGNESAQHNADHPPIDLYDDFMDDDDNSYLEGSDKRPPRNAMNGSATMNNDIERKKAQTIEQIYWPFHRLHDIYGHRRTMPGACYHCKSVPCQCKEDQNLLRGYNIPKFAAPLSDRKDGGFEMDTTGLDLPMKFVSPKHGEVLYDGTIFYLGVIDVLQEYNSRKVVESRYRMLQGMDALEASCVAPKDYAARFVKFFDIYSIRVGKSARGVLSTFKKSTRSSVRTVYQQNDAPRLNPGVEVGISSEEDER